MTVNSTMGRDADRGFSLVEIVVAIALLGLATTGTIATLWTTVRASTVHRDVTNAQVWLQGAADALQAKPREDCDDVGAVGEAEPRIRSIYQSYVRAVPNPDRWPATAISIAGPVLFWDGDQYQAVCHDNDGINLQLVTIRVVDPSDAIVRTLQVVKGA